MIRLWRWIVAQLTKAGSVPAPMTVQQALDLGAETLKQSDNPDPVREARIIMAACLGIDAGRLNLYDQDTLDGGTEAVFVADIQMRAQGQPMSHILGARNFWKHQFKVTPDVLDPRPETETLIATALEVPFQEVLDLGTGSGAILISLLDERAQATGVGTDLSEKALDVARANAADLGVLDRCVFEPSDWFSAVGGTFDLIVSNPPYIALDEMAGLAPELSYEPRMALTDEGDGLSCYRIIAAGALEHLNAGGWLMVEIGPTQGGDVRAMFETAGFSKVEIRPDLDGRDRVVVGQKPL